MTISGHTLVTGAEMRRTLPLGICMPQVQLPAGRVLQLGSLLVGERETIRISWLCVHLLSIDTTPSKLSTALPLCFIGVYARRAIEHGLPFGDALMLAGCDGPGARTPPVGQACELAGPCELSVLLVNNSAGTAVQAAANMAAELVLA